MAVWTPAWAAYQPAEAAFKTLHTTKEAARATMETAARTVNNTVQANPAVPDAAKVAADLPVHKTTRTPVGPIDSHPVLYKVDNEHLLHRLWFSDSVTGKKARPAGAAMGEIREAIVAAGGPAPTDPNAMAFLANETKPPQRNDLDPADVGKTAYCAQRWVNTRGEPGPWSPITSYPIL